MIPNQHWTQSTLGDFAYWVSSDFTAQIEARLEAKEVSKDTLAGRLDVSPSRVSQVLNDPGNLTLGNVVKYARAVGMKVALVAYDDADPDNVKGPIHAEVFTQCWERMGRPQDFFDLDSMTQSRGCWVLTKTAETANGRDSNIRDVKLQDDTAPTNTYAAAAGAGGEWRRRA
jgi:transcriptional regulator with XRE-family HTH domain